MQLSEVIGEWTKAVSEWELILGIRDGGQAPIFMAFTWTQFPVSLSRPWAESTMWRTNTLIKTLSFSGLNNQRRKFGDTLAAGKWKGNSRRERAQENEPWILHTHCQPSSECWPSIHGHSRSRLKAAWGWENSGKFALLPFESNQVNYQLQQKINTITKPSASTILHSQCPGYNKKRLVNIYKEREYMTNLHETRHRCWN